MPSELDLSTHPRSATNLEADEMTQRATSEGSSSGGSDSPTESCSSLMMAKAIEELNAGNLKYEQQHALDAPGKETRSLEVQEKESKDELLFLIASLRLNPGYSDLTIKCRGFVFPVHKVIVCSRSVFLTKACSDGLKDSTINEIELDEDPVLVEKMLDYLYKFDYKAPAIGSMTKSEDSVLKGEVKPYLLSRSASGSPVTPQGQSFHSTDSYQERKLCIARIQTLRGEHALAYAAEYSPGKDTINVPFEIMMYALADRMMIHGLKELAQTKVKHGFIAYLDPDSYSSVITEIYATTPANDRGLRDLAVEFTLNYITSLRSSIGGPAAFQDELLKAVPQFCFDFCVASINKTMRQWDAVGVCEKDWGW